MEKVFDFQKIETYIKKFWEKNHCLIHKSVNYKKKFCIIMPPPNITGYLHMGHAFQQTIIDVLIRYHKMCGKDVLFQMGIDHAGIATQIIVERYLYKKEGKKRLEYKKSEFIKNIWNWKLKSENKIIQQIKTLGYLINCNNIPFTLDNNSSKAVRKVFILLYKNNLIYRKKKLVFWDPHLKTVISDLEVNNKVISHTMWYIKYPIYFYIKNTISRFKNFFLVVATTRPETLLGDTALVVHPLDKRYKKYVGKFVKVPIINRIIPIIADDSIDQKIGTGCMKLTPAHDFSDYEIGFRNKLPMINIFSKDGKILEEFDFYDYQGKRINKLKEFYPRELNGKDRFIARKILLSMIKNLGLLLKKEVHITSVPHGDRSDVILEPILTNQWFLRTKFLSKNAIKVILEDKIQFFPKQYKNMYLSWMNRIEDWCISRQLWWGHKIPVWYDSEENIYVGKNEKYIRKKYNIKKNISLFSESDVLDTWFSSSLWTFVGLGWPNNMDKYLKFHPTNVLVCGYDIIFFWIARMIMMTVYILKNKNGSFHIPFKRIYITGLIRDEYGKKMSKSQGNVLDPLDIINGIHLKQLIVKRINQENIEKKNNFIKKSTMLQFPEGIPAYGTDSLRFTFISLTTTSRNIHWDMNRLKGYKFFCNKIWNASRFVILHISKYKKKKYFNLNKLSFLDQWILLKLNNLLEKYHKYMKLFRFDSISGILYNFIWNKFCDIYLEIIKPILSKKFNNYIGSIIFTLRIIIISIIKLLHPIMPFITEFIANILYKNNQFSKNIIVLTKFPEPLNIIKNKNLFIFFPWFYKFFLQLIKIRKDFGLKKNTFLKIFIKNISYRKRIFLQENYFFLKKIAFLKSIIEVKSYKDISSSIFRLIDNVELFIPIDFNINLNQELERLNSNFKKTKCLIQKFENQLLNKNFLKNAPIEIVKNTKKNLKKYKENYIKIINQKNFLFKK